MVAEAPTMWSAVVTDQVFRGSHGNRLRRQAFASGEDRSRYLFAYDSGTSSGNRLSGTTTLGIGDPTGTISDPDGLIDYTGGHGVVAPFAGHYLASGALGLNSHPWTTGTAVQLWFNVAGVAYFVQSHSVTSSAGIYVSTLGVLALAADDKVSMVAAVTGAGIGIITQMAFSLVCVGW